MGCLSKYSEAIFRRLYGLLDDDELKEDCTESQCLIYTGKDAIIPNYNVGYCNPKRMGSMNYGNPVRDKTMSDHKGYSGCGAQWLSERENVDCTPNVVEMIQILDAFGTLARLEEQCPRCVEMFGKILNGKAPFHKDHAEDFRKYLLKRNVKLDMGMDLKN